jgi:hypothetical protein
VYTETSRREVKVVSTTSSLAFGQVIRRRLKKKKGPTELPEHEERLSLLGLGGSHPLADHVVLVVQETVTKKRRLLVSTRDSGNKANRRQSNMPWTYCTNEVILNPAWTLSLRPTKTSRQYAACQTRSGTDVSVVSTSRSG